MSKLAQNLIDFYKVVANDEELLRLLYYEKDALNYVANKDVKSLNNFVDIRKERIIRAPKVDDISTKKICRICMYLGARESMSRAVSEQEMIFDVFTHIDGFETTESRSLKIADRINLLLSESRITGIGVIKSDRFFPINAPNNYMAYRLAYTFGSGRK